jgi:hypothetical protein
MTPDDPIVAEVRKAGADYLAKFGNDLKAAMEELRRRTEASKRKVIATAPRKISGTPVTKKAG